ncbi:MAG: hypothetical protein EI684_04500 [Candidatus Viridilinea halotolerans]|uniref:DUF11 domain-containing protein n=1 Tax=Candidatus Viridilinea halotolerans TaxID=2491704 RepID=A0A426U663_9CHLR|nr:MAG: hypothetical protein EI684_04500 [Candidatus Viridilinea halotolerans]
MKLHHRILALAFIMMFALLAAVPTTPAAAQSKGNGNAAPAQAGGVSINGNPIAITVYNNLLMAINYEGRNQFYGNNAGGTFVAVDGIVYGSAPPAGGNFRPVAFTPVSNSAVTGAGTAADPFKIVTVATAGNTGVRVTQTTTYVNGTSRYRVDLEVNNTANAARNVRVVHGADLYVNFPGNDLDYGYGFFDPNTGSVGAFTRDLQYVQSFTPITPASAFQEANYGVFWSRIGGANGAAGPGLNNTVDSSFHDAAAGLQFDRTLQASQSATAQASQSATISFSGGFGRVSDVGVTLPTTAPPPQEPPAELWFAVRPSHNVSVAPGSIMAYDVVITNVGRGRSIRSQVVFPFDPNLVELVDASFDVPTTWVSAVRADALVINIGRLGGRDGSTRGTIRFRIRHDAPRGVAISGRIQVGWDDYSGSGRSHSNAFNVLIDANAVNNPTYTLAAEPAVAPAGSPITFASGVFVPNEPVGIWYNRPDGTTTPVGTLRARADGSLQVNFSSHGLAAGTYSMVFFGHWSEFNAAAPFVLQ